MPISDYLRGLRVRIGHAPVMQPGVAVIIFNERGEVLLHRPRDLPKWHTIGGAIDPMEEPAHAAQREAKEETGLDVEIDRVASVYAGPDNTYANGDRVWYTTIAFAARVRSDQAAGATDDETLELRFFPVDALPELDAWDRKAILDSACGDPSARFVR